MFTTSVNMLLASNIKPTAFLKQILMIYLIHEQTVNKKSKKRFTSDKGPLGTKVVPSSKFMRPVSKKVFVTKVRNLHSSTGLGTLYFSPSQHPF